MRTALISVCLLLLFLTPLPAEPDYMEVQRCIWRCFADTKGVQPAYQSCITRYCDEAAPAKRSKASGKPETRWRYGRHPVLGMSAHILIGDDAFASLAPMPKTNPG